MPGHQNLWKKITLASELNAWVNSIASDYQDIEKRAVSRTQCASADRHSSPGIAAG